MILKKTSLIFTLLYCSIIVKAQQPTHFVLGESELSNINIYDLTQDPQGNYWLATDQGVVKYDGYQFNFIKSQSMLGASIFGWTFDNLDQLYCYNLSGQIFRIENGFCKIHFQIPDSLMSNEIYFEFDEDNNLIIATKSLFKVDKSGQIEILYTAAGTINRFSTLFKKRDKSLVSCIYFQKKIIELHNGRLKIDTLSYKDKELLPIQFIYLGDSLHYYDKLSSRILDRSVIPDKLLDGFIPNKRKGLYRLYSDNEFLFVALPTGGVLVYDQNFSALFGGKVLFENEIISAFHKDREGNFLFGTFKGGIIGIPNIHLIDIDGLPSNIKYTNITASDAYLYVGTQDGRVYKINKQDKTSILRQTRIKGIEGIKYIKPTNELLIDENQLLLLDLKSGEEHKIHVGAIKDIESVADIAYLISSNSGVYFYNPLQAKILEEQQKTKLKYAQNVYQLSNFFGRTNAIGYDTKYKTVYAATPQGLKIGNMNRVEYFKLNDVPIICTDIQYAEGLIYIGTQDKGLLIFEDGKLIAQWTTDSGLLSNIINQIIVLNHKVYISTSNGFQILTTSGEVLYVLNPSDGLHNFGVIDFEISDNTLWLVQQKGIQKISLDKIKTTPLRPQIRLNWVIQGVDTIDMQQIKRFNHEQSKFEFQVSSNTLKYQEELEYHYQLSGIDQQWQVNAYKNNIINFLSLPPGNYTFSVKAVLRNQESETISYTFTIAPPYWNTWWFYTLCILLVIGVSGGIFLSFYIRQRKKIQFQNELNNSKLSAIQSQMNPHFIFNALNSIQDFIVLNEKKMAGKYLGKFADLMRIYLNHSQIKTVSLREEIEALALYLELEKLRFDTLDFTIDVDAAIDENLVTIPTLLIQPYIENALKHGLLHKRDDKKLSVSFKLINEHDLIECEIIDNGIGRVASAEVNKMRNPNHQSFATKATKNRLELLNYGHKKPIGEQIIDLYDENDLAKGTKVILRIPILD